MEVDLPTCTLANVHTFASYRDAVAIFPNKLVTTSTSCSNPFPSEFMGWKFSHPDLDKRASLSLPLISSDKRAAALDVIGLPLGTSEHLFHFILHSRRRYPTYTRLCLYACAIYFYICIASSTNI